MENVRKVEKRWREVKHKALDLGIRHKVLPMKYKDAQKEALRAAGTSQNENKVRNAIMQYLGLQRDISAYVFDNVGIYDPRKGVFRKRAWKVPGIADIVGWFHDSGRIFWIEVKTDTGRISKPQIAFKEHCITSGAYHAVCRNLDDVQGFVERIRKTERLAA